MLLTEMKTFTISYFLMVHLGLRGRGLTCPCIYIPSYLLTLPYYSYIAWSFTTSHHSYSHNPPGMGARILLKNLRNIKIAGLGHTTVSSQP